jgi:hypothetical protein
MLPSVGQPSGKKTQLEYLQFLLSTKRLDAARSVARNVALQADAVNLPILIQYCDAMVDGHTDAALEVWNVLCRRKLVPFEPLSPADGHVITNGDFRIKPTEHGFDWRLSRVDGAFVTAGAASEGAAAGGGASIEMSGNQPEQCLLLAQIVPLAPGHKYRLDYEYRGDAVDEDSGVNWEIVSLGALSTISPAIDIQSEHLKMTGDWVTDYLSFNAGAGDAARLSLRYKRALGTVRHQGTVALRRVAIEAIP